MLNTKKLKHYLYLPFYVLKRFRNFGDRSCLKIKQFSNNKRVVKRISILEKNQSTSVVLIIMIHSKYQIKSSIHNTTLNCISKDIRDNMLHFLPNLYKETVHATNSLDKL